MLEWRLLGREWWRRGKRGELILGEKEPGRKRERL
jgi:hypothetical protein